jgi:hypothetical protein
MQIKSDTTSTQPHGHDPGAHYLLVFSWFEHPPRKLLETMMPWEEIQDSQNWKK